MAKLQYTINLTLRTVDVYGEGAKPDDLPFTSYQIDWLAKLGRRVAISAEQDRKIGDYARAEIFETLAVAYDDLLDRGIVQGEQELPYKNGG